MYGSIATVWAISTLSKVRSSLLLDERQKKFWTRQVKLSLMVTALFLTKRCFSQKRFSDWYLIGREYLHSSSMISFRNKPKNAFPISSGFAFSLLLHGVGFALAPLLTVVDLGEVGVLDSDIILSVNLVSVHSDSLLTEPEELTMQQPRRAVPLTGKQLPQPAKMTNGERRPAARREKRKHRSESTLAAEDLDLLLHVEANPSNPIQKKGEPTSVRKVRDFEKVSLLYQSNGFIALQSPELSAESRREAFLASRTASSGKHRRRLQHRVPKQNSPGHVSSSTLDLVNGLPETIAAAVTHEKTVVESQVEVQLRVSPVGPADVTSGIRSKLNSARPRGKFVPAHPKAKNSVPSYPASAKRRLLEGRVVLAVSINDKGEVESVTVREPSAWLILDRAAADAVAKWHFIPASREGNSVDSVVLLPVVFQLSPEPRGKS